MCIMKACEEPTAVGVYWRDDEEWKQYDASRAEVIRQGMADRVNRVELGTLASSKYVDVGGARYTVDLRSMKQINRATGFTRDVKVVNAPEIGTDDIEKQLRACQKEIMSLKKMVMKLEVDLLAVKLDAVKSEANRVSAKISFADLEVKSRVSVEGDLDYWENCDSDGVYLSDDDNLSVDEIRQGI